jgi:hypothetical protein
MKFVPRIIAPLAIAGGGLGLDWFFVGSNDELRNRASGEEVN